MDRRPCLALLLALSLTACAEHDAFPSLAPRDAEKTGFSEPAAPPAPPVAADPALDAEVAAQTAALADAGTAFDAAATRADTATRAARGEAVGGERWIAAQTALAELDEGRARSLDALSALEDLARDRAAALQPAYPALDTAQAGASVQVDAQTARIKALQGSIPQG